MITCDRQEVRLLRSGVIRFCHTFARKVLSPCSIRVQTGPVGEGNLTGEERKVLVELSEKKIQTPLKEKNSADVAEQLKKGYFRIG